MRSIRPKKALTDLMKAASFTDILRTSKNPKEVKILIIIVTHAIAMYTRV